MKFEYHEANTESNGTPYTGYPYLRWYEGGYTYTAGLNPKYNLSKVEFKRIKRCLLHNKLDKIANYLAYYTMIDDRGKSHAVWKVTCDENGNILDFEDIEYDKSQGGEVVE